MLDTALAFHLFSAVPDTSVVILVGDVDQLPSVGPGNVLEDLMASGRIDVVRLTEIFRQHEASRIVVNAHRINRGDFPDTRRNRESSDFFLIEIEDPETIARTIVDLVKVRIPHRFRVSLSRPIRIKPEEAFGPGLAISASQPASTSTEMLGLSFHLVENRRDLALNLLCLGPWIRCIANWSTDDDKVRAIFEGLGGRYNTFLIILRPILNRADAGNHDDELVAEVLAQRRHLES